MNRSIDKFVSLTSVLLLLLSSSCSEKLDPKLIEKVENKPEVEHSIKIWNENPDNPEQRNLALDVLMNCVRDSKAEDVNRANCLKALNQLSGKSDAVLNEIDGLVLPNRIAQIANMFSEIEAKRSVSR